MPDHPKGKFAMTTEPDRGGAATVRKRVERPSMTTIGIIGAGEVGSQIARAAIASGYEVVIGNSRNSASLSGLVAELGPSARAATAAGAAEAGDFVVVAVPLKLVNDMPVELAGEIVLGTNNYMPWRDGHFDIIDRGEKTVHELRQEQLPGSKVAKAFTHIQAPRLFVSARPPGTPDRHALSFRAIIPKLSNSSRASTTNSASTRSTTVRSPSPGAAVRANRRGLRTNSRPGRS